MECNKTVRNPKNGAEFFLKLLVNKMNYGQRVGINILLGNYGTII
jgi:hypothetical protein